ncbi:DNA-directed RNA polymerase III complex subunit Rpc25 [Cryptotrichosporon argae]
MFNLIGVQDTVPVAPRTFGINPAVTIQDALNKKYANKLILGRGLGLGVYDISTAEDGKVTWGNGQMYYRVSFRLMMFVPFIGEVIVGKILSNTETYIRISLGFFQDIYVPLTLLPPNSAYDPNHEDRLFFWYSEADDAVPMDTGELLNTVKDQRLYYEPGQSVRFRVKALEWNEHEPGDPAARASVAPAPAVPAAAAGAAAAAAGAGVSGAAGEGAKANGEAAGAGAAQADAPRDPYDAAGFRIIAGVEEAGLGMVAWWEGEVDEE